MRPALFANGCMFGMIAPSAGRSIVRPITDGDAEAIGASGGLESAISGLPAGKIVHSFGRSLISGIIKVGARRCKDHCNTAFPIVSHKGGIDTACRRRNPFNGPYGLKLDRRSANPVILFDRSRHPA